jgi:hypothetical protein
MEQHRDLSLVIVALLSRLDAQPATTKQAALAAAKEVIQEWVRVSITAPEYVEKDVAAIIGKHFRVDAPRWACNGCNRTVSSQEIGEGKETCSCGGDFVELRVDAQPALRAGMTEEAHARVRKTVDVLCDCSDGWKKRAELAEQKLAALVDAQPEDGDGSRELVEMLRKLIKDVNEECGDPDCTIDVCADARQIEAILEKWTSAPHSRGRDPKSAGHAMTEDSEVIRDWRKDAD